MAAVSGIEMDSVDLFSAGAAQGDLDGALHQSAYEFTFVVGRSAHIGMGIGGSPGCFGRSGDGLVVRALPAQSRLGFTSADCGQTDTAERDRSIFTEVAFHRELHRGAGRRIHWSCALE